VLPVRTPEGNFRWDCVPRLHEVAVARLHELGGVRSLAVSHPPFYTGVERFADAFGTDVYGHAADRAFVTHPHPRLHFWDGEFRTLFGCATLARDVERIGAALEPLAFDAIVGGWWDRVVSNDGKDAVRRSVVPYRQAVEGRMDGPALRWPTPRGE